MTSFPSCKICRRELTSKDPTPFLLPCLQAVCETCASSKSYIFCYSANEHFNLQKTRLCRDLVRKRDILHITIKERPEDLLCTQDGNKAVCWCQDCEEMLCESCEKMHQRFKVTRGHTVLEVDHAIPNTVDEVKYCGIHKRYPLDTYDKTCKIFICVRCCRGDHADHETIDVEEVEDVYRKGIKDRLREITSFESHEEEMLTTTLTHMKSTEEMELETKREVVGTFQIFRQLLDRREQDVLGKLAQQTKQIQQDAMLKKDKIKSNHEDAKRVKEYVNSVSSYPYLRDIFPIKETIDNRTRNMISTRSKDERVYSIPHFKSSGDDTLKSLISQFGDIEVIEKDIPVAVPVTVSIPDSVQRPKSPPRAIPENVPEKPFSVPDPEDTTPGRSPFNELPQLHSTLLKPMLKKTSRRKVKNEAL